ncbi:MULTISPECIES: neutral zinc metallopeptidase [unclassified Rathayibacter]|uniref:KPN_02809 family neutral zinc metallopeptidase n=1 Tax=unclassified Rathayibacter TaxID=2609250 RepID=UPI00188C4D23|nr:MULTISPECIES: neutral zinc metallopeptidase [unclassified Rathayibacter]MBF4463123.1 neutral zinc metallopeptidase [Rathayibacter sp. VKM Ac-2879]MBF4504640.1 neutral zinc metallopeptidase [Rathayibacter sp. VKM Ac-2878]
MTFNDDSQLSGGRVRRRGRTTGVAVGGGVVGIVVLALLSQLLGVDLSSLGGLVGGGGTSPDQVTSTAVACESGADANAQVDCRLEGAAESLDRYWSTATAALGASYSAPAGVTLFTEQTSTGCGGATAAVGPFYCPPDRTIYLDTAFFDELRTRFDTSGGSLAQMYILAHEWGHHIQTLSGAMEAAERSGTGPDSDSVRLELQADCFAGAWVGDASTVPDETGTPYLRPVSAGEYQDALSAAAAVGDDRIQQQATGTVDPEGWTHGSAEQRQRWFAAGFEGDATSCDTFGASQL